MWWRTVDRLGTFWNMRWLLGVRLPVELLPVELLHVSCGVVHCCMCIMPVVFLCGAMLLGPKFLVCRIVHWQFTCRNNNPDPKCCSMLSLQLFIWTLYKLKDMLYLYIPMHAHRVSYRIFSWGGNIVYRTTPLSLSQQIVHNWQSVGAL